MPLTCFTRYKEKDEALDGEIRKEDSPTKDAAESKKGATETNVDHHTAWGDILFENLLSKVCQSYASQPWNFCSGVRWVLFGPSSAKSNFFTRPCSSSRTHPTSVHTPTLLETQRIRAAIYRISLVKKIYTGSYEFLRTSDYISKQDQKIGSYILNRKVGEKPEQVHRERHRRWPKTRQNKFSAEMLLFNQFLVL